MKALIQGVWHPDTPDTPELRRVRAEEKKTFFRARVAADGSTPFAPEAGRYHLYVSYACPWAHRTILYRALKGLENAIGLSVVHPVWSGPNGWVFGDTPLSTPDRAEGFDFLYQAYQAANPTLTAKVTVPVLWDTRTKTIVNNESAEIIRMLNGEFDAFGDASVDFYPAALRPEIDALNARIVADVGEGVYKAGFADTQAAYDAAIERLFGTLDELEARLGDGRSYLLGERVVESDWHLFATLVRFDRVYHGRLKCSVRRLIDYPNLSAYARRLYRLPKVADTVKLDHIALHYYDNLGHGNPQIVAAPPATDFRDAA